MNINALKNRLVKKASMQKVAGYKSKFLKSVLNDISRIHNNPEAQKAVKSISQHIPEDSKLGDYLYALNKNRKQLPHDTDIWNLLEYAKSQNINQHHFTNYDAYINRLQRLFQSRYDKLQDLGAVTRGYHKRSEIADTFAKNLKDKYLV